MPVVITHLSKYGADRACLAGVNLDNGAFVRVKDPWGNFPLRADLTVAGRHLALGDVIGFYAVADQAPHPHHENVRLVPGTLRLHEPECVEVLRDALERVLSPSLAQAIGCEPTQTAVGNSCGFLTPAHTLCVLEATDVLEVVVDPYDAAKVKISWQTDGCTIRSCLDDVRFYADNAHPNAEVVAGLGRAAEAADRCLMACSVAWREDRYWLLIAGLHVLPN